MGLPEPVNVFVVAPSEMHWRALRTVHGAGTEVRFHPLLRVEDVIHAEEIDVKTLLDDAHAELDRFEGSVDAIITHWDFPASILVPLLCRERGLRSPSIESVLSCGHKYWSRVRQHEAIPELTPRFALVDPFADDAKDVELAFPFWLKPVQSFASHLGFRIDDEDDLDEALKTTRDELCRLARPFDRLLAQAGVDGELRAVGGSHCIAEEYLTGVEIAHEGHVKAGEHVVHGTLDMEREDDVFTRFVWPSSAPREVLAEMEDAARRFLAHVGFDDGCYNAEFFWDEAKDRLAMIEVNPRISQSHSYLCMLVDGVSNHEVAVDVALGRPTRFTPGAGRYGVAGKFMERARHDGIVRRVPDEAELERLRARFPSAWIDVDIQPGQRLSELADQDAYSYLLAEVYLGAADRDELLRVHDELVGALSIEIERAA